MDSPLLRRQIKILLWLGSLLFFWSIGGGLLFAAPKPHLSCLMENQPSIVAEKQPDGSRKEKEVDDWYVTCKIVENDKEVFNQVLPLGHPTAYRDAMEAIEDFRLHKAPQILKDLKKKVVANTPTGGCSQSSWDISIFGWDCLKDEYDYEEGFAVNPQRLNWSREAG